MSGIGGAIAGLGKAAGAMGSGGSVEGASYDPSFVDPAFAETYRNEAHMFLDQALRAAIPYTEFFTEKALDAQKEQFALARTDAKEYFERSEAALTPHMEAGFNALDTYQDTLGQARPLSGSSAMYHAAKNKAVERAARSRMQQQAMSTANKIGMNPKNANAFIQAATYGGNRPGLLEGLRQYRLTNTPNDRTLRATESPDFGTGDKAFGFVAGEGGGEQGGQHFPGSDQSFEAGEDTIARGGPNPYLDLLGMTSGRFNVEPYNEFAIASIPLAQELSRARNNLSSRQRTLANLARTGYSQLQPTEYDI